MAQTLTNITSILNDVKRSLGNSGNALSYESITVTNSAIGFTNLPATATSALVIVDSTIAAPSFAIRFKEDGSTPVASAGGGMPRSNTDAFEIKGAENLKRFLAIQEGAGTHYLNVTYYRI